jgi:hypothetical protein
LLTLSAEPDRLRQPPPLKPASRSRPKVTPEFVIAGLAFALIGLLLAGRVWWMPAHISVNWNEGWNAFQTARAFGAGPLYPGPDALTGNNYPPLSFYLVGEVARLVGDAIVAGRIVSLLAMLATAGLVFATIRRLAPTDRWAPALGVILFLGFSAVRFRHYVAMDDPQWLAHAFMTSALLLVVWDQQSLSPRRIAAAAVLVLLGGLSKHNLVALPLALTVWLAMHDRRALGAWLGAALVLNLAAALACWQAFGPNIFTGIFKADRIYSWTRMTQQSLLVIPLFLPMLVIAASLLRERRHDHRVDLILLFIAFAVPIGVLQRGGDGISYNAHFETLVALSIGAPLALSQRQPEGRGRISRHALLWLAAPLLVLLPMALRQDFDELSGRGSVAHEWGLLESAIAATPGPVACETQALCYWAGKDFELDFFLYDQRLRRGHDDAALRGALAKRRFAAVEMDVHPGEPPSPIDRLITASYRPVFERLGMRLFRPRSPL